MIDFTKVQLGKRPATFDPKTPRFEHHKMASAPAPSSADWTRRLPRNGWGLWKNDELGDCTAVGIGNALLGWTAYSQPHPLSITTDQVVKFYSATTGYDGTAATDQGGNELSVLKWLSKHGFDAGRATPEQVAFASIEPTNTVALKNAIAHLGVAYLGIQLPLSAQYQNVWERTNGADGDDTPGSWGGHCVVAKGYDHDYVRIITWGWTHLATWDWMSEYMDEAYGLLSPDWLNASGLSPEGLNLDRLQADLQSLNG
jgi:hypothetical protein